MFEQTLSHVFEMKNSKKSSTPAKEVWFSFQGSLENRDHNKENHNQSKSCGAQF